MVAAMDRAMLNAVADTFENLAFMEALPASGGRPETDNETLSAALLLHEPLQGEIRIAFSRRLMTAVASTVFGLPEQDCTDTTLRDVSAEVLNTISGRFLSEMLPEHQAFRIGLPEILPPDLVEKAEDWREWNFEADGHPFAVSLLELSQPDLPEGQEAAGCCSTC